MALHKDKEFALKIEKIPDRNKKPFLSKDFRVYASLYGLDPDSQPRFNPTLVKESSRKEGFPSIYAYTKDEKYFYLILEVLMNNLESVLSSIPSRSFNQKTVLSFTLMALERLETLHTHGFVHRDIKPANFVTGKEDENTVYMVDFGLSERYIDSSTNQHVKYSERNPVVGTARFMSVDAHLGRRQCRRDDVESLFYLSAYLSKGTLPWQNNKKDKHNLTKIRKAKEEVDLSVLFSNLPLIFPEMFKETRKLRFEDEPPYEKFREMLKKELLKADLRLEFKVKSFRNQTEMKQKPKNKQFKETFMPRNIPKLEANSPNTRVKRNKKVRERDLQVVQLNNINFEGSEETIDQRIHRRINNQVRIQVTKRNIASNEAKDYSSTIILQNNCIRKTSSIIVVEPIDTTNEAEIKERVQKSQKFKSTLPPYLPSTPDKLKNTSISIPIRALENPVETTEIEKKPSKNSSDFKTTIHKNSLSSFKKGSSGSSRLKNFSLKLRKLIKKRKSRLESHYTRLEKLGVGTFSVVELMEDNLTKEKRAVKTISKNFSEALIEIDILRAISHPNIMEIYEIIEDKQHIHIVSEYLEGKELFGHLSVKKKFKEADAKTIMFQILIALNYLHAHKIIHRDIKPENVVFTYRRGYNEVKLIDLGSAAKVSYTSQIMSEFQGTSYYIAPEVFRGAYNEQCDIWSAGIVLYILLCSYPPFNADNREQIYKLIVSQPLFFEKKDWEEISKEAFDLVKQMLHKNPDKRITAQQCLEHPWFSGVLPDNPVKEVTLERLRKFAEESEIKKIFLFYAALHLELKKEKSKISMEFHKFDLKRAGFIGKEAFEEKFKGKEGVFE